MSKYEFKVKELAPVTHAYLIKGQGVMFWYEGETPEDDPFQMKIEDGVVEKIQRPLLRDRKTIRICTDNSRENCIRHINTRIANYLLDQYEANIDTAPEWKIRTTSDTDSGKFRTVIPESFGHFQSIDRNNI